MVKTSDPVDDVFSTLIEMNDDDSVQDRKKSDEKREEGLIPKRPGFTGYIRS